MAEREADLRERAQGHLAERAAETGQRWWGECGDGRGASGTTRTRGLQSPRRIGATCATRDTQPASAQMTRRESPTQWLRSATMGMGRGLTTRARNSE